MSTRIEKQIYAALSEVAPSVMKVRQLYRRAWTSHITTYNKIDFDALNQAIMACFGKEQFRAIRSFGVNGK